MSNPLAEIFGFPILNEEEKALRYRKNHLCPFGNRVPNCTKDKAESPLGVCSIHHAGNQVITCPIRFQEDWIILENAVHFAFPEDCLWTSLSEIRLLDRKGLSAGNIDYVLIRHDEQGKVLDFASLEVQGVYISGNLRNAFEKYMESPASDFQWQGRYYPSPDYLSSSRKRLIPQMLYKGGIFKTWGRKQCVAIQKSFFDTLPAMQDVAKDIADIAWFLYDLEWNEEDIQYHLVLSQIVYTKFDEALRTIITPEPGNQEDFVELLQFKLSEKLKITPDTFLLGEGIFRK